MQMYTASCFALPHKPVEGLRGSGLHCNRSACATGLPVPQVQRGRPEIKA